MRSFAPQQSLLNILLLIVGLCNFSVLQVAAAGGKCIVENFCDPDLGTFSARQFIPTNTLNPIARDITNAERMARGLPLKSPTRRHRAIGMSISARAQPSSLPTTTFTGVIEVRNADANDQHIGYIGRNYVATGPMSVAPSVADALKVQFKLVGTSGSQIEITALDGNPAAPFLGLVQGRDNSDSNIGSQKFNYLYFDLAFTSTSPGSNPQHVPSVYSGATGRDQTVESSVWSINLTTGAIAANWINTNSLSAATSFWSQQGFLYAGGDPSAFQARYSDPITHLHLVFIPA